MTRNEIVEIMRADGPCAAYAAVFSDRWASELRMMPSHMQEGIALYVLLGVHPGGFLTAFLSNDLMGALGKADQINQSSLPAYGSFFYNSAPSGCFGGVDAFSLWVDRGGYVGRSDEAAA